MILVSPLLTDSTDSLPPLRDCTVKCFGSSLSICFTCVGGRLIGIVDIEVDKIDIEFAEIVDTVHRAINLSESTEAPP